MNQRLENRDRTVRVLQLASPVSQGELVTIKQPDPNAVIETGPMKGLYADIVEDVGLNKKKYIGVNPVGVHQGEGRPFLQRILTGLTRGLLSVRYDVVVHKDDKVTESVALHGPIKGALVLLTPHTGYDDPAVVYSKLAPFLPCRPVATENLFNAVGLKKVFNFLRALPVPDTTNPLGIDQELKVLVAQIVTALRNGENIGLHPSGALMRGNGEVIGSSSLAFEVLKHLPDLRVISVNTVGMNGSEFSWSGQLVSKPGEEPRYMRKQPSAGTAAGRLLSDLKYNITHPWTTGFKPFKFRRDVDITVRDVTAEFRACKTAVDQNKILEGFANAPHPDYGVGNPALHVPGRGSDKSGVRMFTPAEAESVGSGTPITDPAEIAKAENTVYEQIARLAKTDKDKLKPTDFLRDLNLDSLKINNDVMLWVNKTFERNFMNPDGLRSVQNVVDAATGKLSPLAGIEWKEVSDKYKAQLQADGAAKIPDGSQNIVDAFVRQLRENPKRIAFIDEIKGESTYEDLAVMVSLLIPEMKKLPGHRVGLMFPNSVAGTAVMLAISLAGKNPCMLNPQWNDEQAKAAMDTGGVDVILTAQAALRALKGKKQLDDIEAVAKGDKKQEQVDNDPTNTPYPSLEDKFVVIENFTRVLDDVHAIKTAKFGVNKVKRELFAQAAQLPGEQEVAGLFTSGSTSMPKGLAYRHEQVMRSALSLATAFQLEAKDSLLHISPSFHLVGYTAGNMATMMGVATVNVSNPRQPAIASYQAKLRQPTITVGPPSLLNAIAKAAGPNGLPSLKRIVLGAEALTPEVEANLRAAAPNAQLIQGYGMTETGVTFVERFDPRNADDRSLGEPLDGIEYRLVDPSDMTREVGPNEEGVLVVRGLTVVTPEQGFMGHAPDDAFTQVDGKTWFVTGDIVKRKVIKDADGVDHTVVKFIDRASRFSKVNGERVGHATLEPPIAKLLPEPADGSPRVFVVEGAIDPDSGQPTLVAYAVPGRKDGKAVDVNGEPLTYDKIRAALSKEFNGDPKYNAAEIRLVKNIELLGTGKVNLGKYKKAGKLPFDGETLKR